MEFLPDGAPLPAGLLLPPGALLPAKVLLPDGALFPFMVFLLVAGFLLAIKLLHPFKY
jgi:hypothetical protein